MPTTPRTKRLKESPQERRDRQKRERAQLVAVLRAAGNTVSTEQPLGTERPFRFDVAIVTPRGVRVALEVEGLHGRHQRIAGFLRDMEKYNEAILRGWKLLRCTTRDVANGDALQLLSRAGVPVEAAR